MQGQCACTSVLTFHHASHHTTPHRNGIPLDHARVPAICQVRSVTAWPTALTAAASWDAALLTEYGEAMAAEQFGKGTNVMLGPGTNIARVPLNGRLWECVTDTSCMQTARASTDVWS